MPPFLDLRPQRVPPRSRLGGDLIPLAPDLVIGGPFAAPDTVELVADLAAGRCRATTMTMTQKSAEIIAKTAPITP